MQRPYYLAQVQRQFEITPCVALLGPRQSGKTTLATNYAKRSDAEITYFDLENPIDLAQLNNPMLALEPLRGLIVIDEIQLRPDLFPILRVLIDQHLARQFLILGSASRDLIQQSSESLAGRISYLEVMPFSYDETDHVDKLWLRGGFPLSYLAQTDLHSYDWRQAYITTFLERDIPALGFKIPANTIRRFWMMLTHYHGQMLNTSELGQSLGVAHTTIRHYLDILTGTFMIRELTPWIENIKKRQVKTSKIYFRDSGLYHALLGIADLKALRFHPKLGASWEGFAMEEIIRHHHARPEECYFWGVHSQAELDCLIIKDGKKLGFEFKYSDAPVLTTSMSQSLENLNLDRLTVIYPGKKNYRLSEKIEVIGLESYLKG